MTDLVLGAGRGMVLVPDSMALSVALLTTCFFAFFNLVLAKFYERAEFHTLPGGLVAVHFEFRQHLELTDEPNLTRTIS